MTQPPGRPPQDGSGSGPHPAYGPPPPSPSGGGQENPYAGTPTPPPAAPQTPPPGQGPYGSPYGQQPQYGDQPYGQQPQAPYGQPPYGQPGQAPYGGAYPAPQPPPGPPSGGGGNKRIAVIAGSVVAALVLVGGGIFLATSGGDGGKKAPEAKGTAPASPSPEASDSPSEDPATEDPIADPTGTSRPAGSTGYQGQWQDEQARTLTVGDRITSGAAKGNYKVSYLDAGGKGICTGIGDDRSVGAFRMAVKCIGKDTGDEVFGANLTQADDVITLTWDKGGTVTLKWAGTTS
ncbi:hypothetical protein [Streptomyces sp. NPDC046821]|uniref:hypothetical protein n=1 Tax=Streptomyces sp. NPDC046821 TaxID=3154702 RepID=UPI0033C5884A